MFYLHTALIPSNPKHEGGYNLSIQHENLGKDKLGVSWVVFAESPAPETSATSVTFHVCSPADVNKSVGKATLTIRYSDQIIGKVEDIGVDHDYRCRGIGSLLLDYLERWAVKKNIKKLWGDLVLIDLDHIGILKSFYKKHGFTVILNKKPSPDRNIGKVYKTIS